MLHRSPIHPAPLAAGEEVGAGPALDLAAGAGDPARAFLGRAWFAAQGDTFVTMTGACPVTGRPLLALPLSRHRVGPLAVRQVAGPYWPWRSFPVADALQVSQLSGFLAAPQVRRALGPAWRLGPTRADDPALALLEQAAPAAGWRIVRRALGRMFVLDLERLRAGGSWPSSKTLRKNRWLERKLAEGGTVDIRSFAGGDWSGTLFDRLAAIEAKSWVGREGGDSKFLDPETRRGWEAAVGDPALAGALRASILSVGGGDVAFAFALRSGPRLHIIANSFDEAWRAGSPGRLLLYHDLQQALADGATEVDWGCGDPGYKSEMGASAGPELVDLLMVRSAAAERLARLLWRSPSDEAP